MFKHSLTNKRNDFFKQICHLVPAINAKIVVVTHILNDRAELLSALSSIAEIEMIVAIPYSINQQTLNQLEKEYKIFTPTLDEMLDENYLFNLLVNNVADADDSSLIIMEIGGYFAQSLQSIKAKWKNNFIGVIESTEAGHRAYESLDLLPCSVVSVSRGSLKAAEYSVVGASCVFSAEKLLRESGILLQNHSILTIGYGKVGQGLVRNLARFNCDVCVYDSNPIKKVIAYSEGYKIMDKVDALKTVDIIFGATGNNAIMGDETTLIKKGTTLISCSSKEAEFDMNYIRENYIVKEVSPNFEIYYNDNHYFNMLAYGAPVNFIDGAVIGPILTLVQAEIIYALKKLIKSKGDNKIIEISEDDRKMLADIWLEHFNAKDSYLIYQPEGE
jgi:adenosylhomocysteinase